MSVYGTLVEEKMRRFKGECAHFSFSKCHIYIHGDASANFSTNSHDKDNSAATPLHPLCSCMHSPASHPFLKVHKKDHFLSQILNFVVFHC